MSECKYCAVKENGDPIGDRKDLLTVHISLLGEKKELYVGIYGGSELSLGIEGFRKNAIKKIKYCPMCGRKLKHALEYED